MPTNWRRFRSCMTKVLDQYYFKELPPAKEFTGFDAKYDYQKTLEEFLNS